MALRATIYKIELQVNDLDRQVFETFPLSLACHPSETEERLMVRLLAFALYACEGLQFGRGLSSEDEATLWQHDLSGALQLWVEVGLPDERVLRRACGRAEAVVLFTYGGRSASLWWMQNKDALAKQDNLTVIDLPSEFTQALASKIARNSSVQVTAQDGEVWMSVGEETFSVRPEVRQRPVAGRR